MTSKDIERKAAFLISEVKITEMPVSVVSIAEKLGILIRAFEFGEEISGALIMEGGKGVIGFNSSESKVRQRFTIAHEIGHYVLHQPTSNIFFDEASSFSIKYRSNRKNDNPIQERQANAFAAALLMPQKFLIAEIKERNLDLNDEKSLKYLAKKFNVSITAMAIRLSDLKLFTYHF